MSRYRMHFSIIWVVTLLWAWPTVSAKTWRLEKGSNWQVVSEKTQDRYLLAVAEIKKLVGTGQTETVKKALEQLKTDFPQITGPDLDAFTKAELLFCKGKFVKAIRSYDKFLAEHPESEFYEAAIDREFAIATAFLAGRKLPVLKVFRIKGYAEGEKIMERISDRAGDAPIGIKAAVAIAQSFERRRKFNEAHHKWSEISSRWPSGQTAKDSLLGMARCKHAAYKGPKYDASDLISAKSYYEDFKLRYPKESEQIGVESTIKQIAEQLAYKQFDIGRYYQKIGDKQSANFYYRMVVDNWPQSTAAKAARQITDN